MSIFCLPLMIPIWSRSFLQMMETLVAEAESVREGIGQTVVRNLKVMARMGTFLEDAVSAAPIRNFLCALEFFPGKAICRPEQ